METLQTPLNKAQLELLKLFSRVKSEEELMDLKRLIVEFYAKPMMDRADKMCEERGYTQEDMEKLANLPS
jgi:hypothetical protein